MLWEGIEKSYEIMCTLSAKLNVHRPRTKYVDVEKANLSYRKRRRHTKVQTRKLTRRLLNLLGKILKETRTLERENAGAEKLLTARQKSDIEIITRVYRQQKAHFENNNPRESVKDRIVSISKPYVRPIVRGKEVKSVEFGAKCNNIQVDGLSFIEKLSFNAFTGYAGSANRGYCKDRGIQTSFVKRGRPSLEKKESDIIRNELARVRATRMEGSFGTQKEHYGLKRIKARTKLTEILYIFFGIHTANVVQLVRREVNEIAQAA